MRPVWRRPRARGPDRSSSSRPARAGPFFPPYPPVGDPDLPFSPPAGPQTQTKNIENKRNSRIVILN
ncbi:hypothetical protein BN12_2200008 [Nostocoides japonicum T1-X7]|uniref:Uncharacterized protein n=1 Tax=Nostocoides japonicum T1-X7 TaxID=1194083 RepID=A0A077LXZ1_9MICO|nr:hypothetical protein BN12_2200008 [Tetrasphaera japonica T1-X7]